MVLEYLSLGPLLSLVDIARTSVGQRLTLDMKKLKVETVSAITILVETS